MENPHLLVLIDNLPHLLGNVGLSQHLLDLARAQLDQSTVRVTEAVVQAMELWRMEAQLLTGTAITEEELNTWSESVAVFVANVDLIIVQLLQHWFLLQVVGFLVVVRAVASARSRAHLLPGVLLAAASAALVVYASTGGGVVPGFKSFVRFSVLMLSFLFG